MIKISQRDNEQEIIKRLRSLQYIHDNLVRNLFKDYGSKMQHKEISDRFWDVVPAELRNKYRTPITSIRNRIRDIIKEYPGYFEDYKKKNRPYFQKQEKAEQQV